MSNESVREKTYLYLRDCRTITVYVIAWVEDGVVKTEALTDATDAALELDCRWFNKGHHEATMTEHGVDLSDAYPSGVVYTALHRDGEKAEGFFPGEREAADYCSENYPNEPGSRKKKLEYNPLKIELV